MPDINEHDDPGAYELFTEAHVVGIWRIGRVVAQSKRTMTINTATGMLSFNVRVPDLKMIEYILNIQFDMSNYDGDTEYIDSMPVNKKISGNVVGMSIYLKTTVGATLIAEVIAFGPP